MFLLRSITIARQPISHALKSSRTLATMVKPAGLFSNRYKIEEMPDLTGKVAVVTGGSRGIGEACVTALVQKGCEVHIISATTGHQEEAKDNVEKATSTDIAAQKLIHTHAVDMGSLNDLIPMAQNLASSLKRLDLLHLNAGVGVAPFGLTQDGLGNHYAINYLAHLVLADIFAGKMKETAKEKQGGSEVEKFSTRIVLESSELHRGAPNEVKCESLEEMNEDIGPLKLYGRSKLFDIYLGRELVRHLPALNSSTPIVVASVHPGAVGTEQQQGATEAYGALGKVVEAAGDYIFMDQGQGAESALWALTSPAVVERREEAHGAYFTEADGKVGTESSQAQDGTAAQKLWYLSTQLLADKFKYDMQLQLK